MLSRTSILQVIKVLRLATVLLVSAAACSADRGPSQDIDSRTQALSTNGLSTASLQLQVLTNSCGANQAQQFFKVVNNGTTNIKTSDIKIRFWVDDISSSGIAASINTGGCLTNASGCFHQVSGVTAAVASFSPACGPDVNHQANKEITISSTDSTLLAPGQSWSNVQVVLHVGNYANFSPGTSNWFSPCLSGVNYAPDNHFALYYQNTLVYASGVAAPDCRAPHGTQQLTGHRTPAMINAPYVGPVPDSTVIQLTIGLPLRNSDTLQSEIQQVADPSSPKYRQYRTVSGFTDAYAPLTTSYQPLITWAQAKGFGSSKSFPNRLLLDVSAPASTVERALYINLNYYSRPDGSVFYAPDREPSLDLDTTITPVLYISNLNDLHVPRGHSGSGGSARYRGADLRNAYASCHLDLTGQGQSIGIFGYGGFTMSDIRRYFNFPATQVLNITTMNRTLPPDMEMTSDIEMALSMAPNAAIVVFEGTVGSSAESDTMLGLMATTEPLSLQLSSSWDWGYTPNSKTLMAEFQAQGQSFFQASGDWGKFPDEGWSADLAGSTIVGGTRLSTNDPAGDPSGYYDHETCWPMSGGWIANGPTTGIDPVAIPDYQVGITSTNPEVSGTYRNFPDVAMVATGIEITFVNAERAWWGTSASTPLWAGFMALINEKSAANGLGAVGFANPVLYAIGKSAIYGDMFNDIDDSLGVCRNDTGSCDANENCTLTGDVGYHTVAGYDLVTGLGSPKCAMIGQLASDTPVPSLAVAVGEHHTCALRGDGSVWCWGWNAFGQLGNGTTTSSSVPVPVLASGMPKASAIAAGGVSTCALGASDGSVWCWGWNGYGQFGDGTTDSQGTGVTHKTPTRIAGWSGVSAIASGTSHNCYLMAGTGTVQCSGNDYFAQLGAGPNQSDTPNPVTVIDASGNALSGVKAISAAGYRTCALLNDGTVWCWGFRNYAELGESLDYNPVQTVLPGIARAVATSGDYSSCALLNDGTVWCWGNNSEGQLGDGVPLGNLWASSLTPVRAGDLSNVTAIGATPVQNCAVVANDTVKCWGLQVTGTISPTPVDVPSLTGTTSVVGGGYDHDFGTICTRSSRAISCWGNSEYGQVGDGSTVDRYVPVTVHFF